MRSDLLTGVTTTATGDWLPMPPPPLSIQGVVVGTGAVSATVTIEVSNNGTDAESEASSILSLSGTTRGHAGASLTVPWELIRARVSAVSGTGAAVTVTIGDQR